MDSSLKLYSLKYSLTELNSDIIGIIMKKYISLLKCDIYNSDNIIFRGLIYCKSGDVYSTNLIKNNWITYFNPYLDIRSIDIKLSYYGKYDITCALIKRPDNTCVVPDGRHICSFNGKIYDKKYLNRHYLISKDNIYKSSINKIEDYVSL